MNFDLRLRATVCVVFLLKIFRLKSRKLYVFISKHNVSYLNFEGVFKCDESHFDMEQTKRLSVQGMTESTLVNKQINK